MPITGDARLRLLLIKKQKAHRIKRRIGVYLSAAMTVLRGVVNLDLWHPH